MCFFSKIKLMMMRMKMNDDELWTDERRLTLFRQAGFEPVQSLSSGLNE